MDSLVRAAARALNAGDPLGALKRIALRDDAPVLLARDLAHDRVESLQLTKMLQSLLSLDLYSARWSA